MDAVLCVITKSVILILFTFIFLVILSWGVALPPRCKTKEVNSKSQQKLLIQSTV